MLPWLASGLLVGGSYDPPRGSEWALACAPLLGLAMGALWQALNRRDLADRLIVPAVLSLFGMAAGVIGHDGAIRVGVFLYSVGVVSGLVITEQWLRRRGNMHSRDTATPERSTANLTS